jgi:hypothetical protein
VESCGHAVHDDQPEALKGHIRDFLHGLNPVRV